jgi:hypothetical protein
MLGKAGVPLVKAGAALVIEFVVDLRLAIDVIGPVPFGEAPLEGDDFLGGLGGGPVGTGCGLCRAGEQQ